MKIVHAADLHLDSPLRGLERYEGAPVERIREATRRAMENLTDLCLTEGAKLLLIAGDLYDGTWKDYSTALFFTRQLSRLRQADVRVVLVRGNHDAASQVTRYLELPENAVELGTARPETRVFEELGIAVHGQGFPRRAVTEDLASGYPAALPDLLNIGLLHTALDGRPGHEPYAPTRLETLASKGYDYWALGHIHTRDVVSREPWVVFPGNLQGRHARETGPKGATLISVEDTRIVRVEPRALDVARWARCAVDVGGSDTPDAVLERVRQGMEQAHAEADGRILAVRVELIGQATVHGELMGEPERWDAELRALAADLAEDSIWLERLVVSTLPDVDTEALAAREDVLGQVARALLTLRRDVGNQAALLERFSDLRSKLPAEVSEGADGLRLDDPETIAQALDDVERLLLPRLLAVGDER